MTRPLNPSAAASIFRTVVQSRYSTKRFQPHKRIPSSTLQNILETTLRSPSGFNLQPTHVILVQCPHMKQELSKNCMLGIGNIYRATDASTLAVFLADLQPNKRIPKIVELEQTSNVRAPGYMATLSVASTFLLGEGRTATLFKQITTDAMSPIKPMPNIEHVESWSYKNASLMAQTYVLAATSHGLATCMMEGFDVRRAREILDVPDRYGIPLMVATGYEYEGPDKQELKRSPRLDFSDVFFENKFGQPMPCNENEEHFLKENNGSMGEEIDTLTLER